MLERARIGRNVRLRTTEHRFHPIVVEFQSSRTSFTEHPAQRDLRQSAFRLGITSSHIRVDTREPHLFQVGVLVAYEILTEEGPPLIDGNCMADDLDIR